jgi:hypothetical protein
MHFEKAIIKRRQFRRRITRRNAADEEAVRLSAAARFFLSSEALLPKELFYRSVPSERQGLCFGFNKMQEKNINPRVLPGG